MLKKQISKKILAYCLMFIFLISSISLATFAWFTDSKTANVSITVASLSGSAESSDTISPSDLIANNTFTKNLTVSITSQFDVYFRVYAVCSTQTSSGNDTTIVSLTSVSSTVKGSDNKFYYCSSGTTPSSLSTISSLSLTCTFSVSSSYSEEYYVANGKTTITYYVEYCQSEGFDGWEDI